MPWIIGGGMVLGGLLGASGSKSAAGAQKKAANQSAQVQRYMFDQSQAMQAPWQQTGASALSQLAGLYGLNPINYMGTTPGGAPGGGSGGVSPQQASMAGALLGAGGGSLGAAMNAGRQATGAWDFNDPSNNPGGAAWQGGGIQPIPGSGASMGLSPHDMAGMNQSVSGGQGAVDPVTGTPLAPPPFGSTVPTREAAMANFHTSPGYQFRMDEGMKALGGMASAQGQRGHGATAADIMRYGQGLASEEYNQYTNRLAAMAGLGQTSAGQMGQQGLLTGRGIGDAYSQAGNARASGILGVTNSLGNTINNAAWMYGMYGGGGGGGAPQTTPAGPNRAWSDVRLKKNISRLGPRHYSWEWNDAAVALGIGGPTEGEIAQEVMEYAPDRVSVGPHGYLQIRVA